MHSAHEGQLSKLNPSGRASLSSGVHHYLGAHHYLEHWVEFFFFVCKKKKVGYIHRGSRSTVVDRLVDRLGATPG